MVDGKSGRGNRESRRLDRRGALGLLGAGVLAGAAGYGLGRRSAEERYRGAREREQTLEEKLGRQSEQIEGLKDKARRTRIGQRRFMEETSRIYDRHWAQTVEERRALQRKYEGVLLGRVEAWDLIQDLAHCVDVTDPKLGCTTQLIHTQQVLAAMEEEGVQDPHMLLAGLMHDVGKVLALRGEAPENVFCMIAPIEGTHPEPGVGLDKGICQWNHDEFVYSRLKDHVPEHVAWLLRYHSIHFEKTEPYMDARDRELHENWLKPFRHFDQHFKSKTVYPGNDSLAKHRDLLREYFPGPILI